MSAMRVASVVSGLIGLLGAVGRSCSCHPPRARRQPRRSGAGRAGDGALMTRRRPSETGATGVAPPPTRRSSTLPSTC